MTHKNKKPDYPQYRTLVGVCVLAFSLTACSSGSNSTPTGDESTNNDASANNNPPANEGGAQQAASALDGGWEYCGSLQEKLVFSGNTFEQYLGTKSTADCSGAANWYPNVLTGEAGPYTTGTYELLEEFTTDSGVEARKLNFKFMTNVEQFDIVYLGVAGQFVRGTSVGYSEADRPTSLKFTEIYIKE